MGWVNIINVKLSNMESRSSRNLCSLPVLTYTRSRALLVSVKRIKLNKLWNFHTWLRIMNVAWLIWRIWSRSSSHIEFDVLFQHHDQLRYSLLKLPYDILSFLLPIWTLLYYFRPQKSSSAEIPSEEVQFYYILLLYITIRESILVHLDPCASN